MRPRRPARRRHFIPPSFSPVRIEAAVPLEAAAVRTNRPVSVAQAIAERPVPYWVRAGISKVYGASPAIVFEPHPPMASTRRPFRQRSPKQRAAAQRWAALLNGGRDHIHGYDDGEYEPQTRWEGYYIDVASPAPGLIAG